MKKFTRILVCASAVAAAVPANAQDWIKLDQKLVDNYQGHAITGDFLGTGRHGIYHTGAYSTEWCFNHRMQGGEEPLSVMMYQNEDGTFTLDWNCPVDFEDPSWNPESHVEGQTNNTYMRYPVHGIAPAGRANLLTLDFNNDGKLDLITFNVQDHEGWWYFWDSARDDNGNDVENRTPRRHEKLTLYKNLGDGRFEMVQNTGLLELSSPDWKSGRCISAGDYDRDGYIDLIVSGNYHESAYEEFVNEKHYYNRYVKLYRNRGNVAEGEPQFEEMNIATTIGGVYTQQVNDSESGEIIFPKEELKGQFAPISGNVQFADINNDGWLDVIISGYGDNIWDGNYSGGALVRIYLNKEGKEFVDITDQDALLEGANNSSIVLADFNKNGYLDLLVGGYSWHLDGLKSILYMNQKEGSIYNDYNLDSNLPGGEEILYYASDFDGDGNVDIYCASGDRSGIYYGTDGTSFEFDDTDMQGWTNDRDHWGTIGDYNGDGIADIYVPHERAYDNGSAVKENGNPAKIMLNNIAQEVTAPAAPSKASYEIANGKLNIDWEYDEDAAIESNLAYNIYVKYNDGSVMTLVPADPETGFVKVVDGKHVALRPNIKSYSIANSDNVAKVGVQAISLNNMTASAFTEAANNAGITGIDADSTDAPAAYYNLQGIRIENPAEGQVVIKVQGNKASKIVF